VRIPRRRRIVAALAERGGRRAPHFPSVSQAELTRSATASTALAQPRGDREENAPPCNPLKNHKTGKESRSRTGRPVTPSSPRSQGSPASPQRPSSRSASSSQCPFACQAAPAPASPARSSTSPIQLDLANALPRDASVAENHPSADGALSLRWIFRGRIAAARQYALLCARGETTVSRMIFKSNHSDQLST
jgi:hypothetical protein